MSKIHVMNETLANKIAAGEVIERVSSVVKELVENSIDAHAKVIKIELIDSGITSLVVTDDGVGMDREDAKLAFSRHATSKLYNVDDLFNISYPVNASDIESPIITELEKQAVVSVNPQQVADDRILGIDFSVPSFYVDSNGDSVSYPHAYRTMEKKLIKEQKKLSRKVYGSNNYYKQLLKVQRLHQKVANIRKDFLHKLSRELVSNYDIICFEDINLSNMKRCLRFGKSISDEGFGAFRTYVAYKALRLGKHVIKVDKWYASTKTCNHCGHKNDSLTLKDREWECAQCGHDHNRDHNAAMNIRDESVRILLSA